MHHSQQNNLARTREWAGSRGQQGSKTGGTPVSEPDSLKELQGDLLSAVHPRVKAQEGGPHDPTCRTGRQRQELILQGHFLYPSFFTRMNTQNSQAKAGGATNSIPDSQRRKLRPRKNSDLSRPLRLELRQLASKSDTTLDTISILAQIVKNLPAIQGTWVLSRVGRIRWRRAWQLASVFLPGESHGQRSLAGHSPWGRKESRQN